MEIKIFEKLKAKHTNVSASLLTRIAKVYAKTVTKEEEIDAAIAGSDVWVSEMSTELQAETDRRVGAVQKENEKKLAEAVAAAKAEAGGGTPPGNPKPGDPKPDDTPEWAKALLESHKTLTEKVAAYDSERNAKSHLEKLTGKLKERGIPEKYYSPIIDNRSFKDDAELDSYVEKIETNHKAFLQDLSDKGLASQPKPTFGAADTEGVSRVVKDYIAEKTAAASDNGLGGKKL